ncbi:pilus assembly FimT family protein [Roseibacillus ishigakijimensis]|nr:prepilin-type N-terminal cleavage/methylation domain-containing protein [Roseibacillus ishigakijimensis]
MPRGGFTLLEMMVTLSLVALLISFVFMAYKPDSPAERMKRAVVELEALSARGHTMAVLHQKPFWLRFERNKVILQGAELTEVDTSAPSEEFGASYEEELAAATEVQELTVDYDSFEFPAGMEVFVRRWGAPFQAWFHQEKPEDPAIFWNFEQSGLCEPISLRLEIGESWTELEMDPLTARVADESSEIYD